MNSYRVIIPVALGLAGAAANFLAVRSATATAEIVVASRALDEGSELRPEHLTKVVVRADEALEVATVSADRLGDVVGRRLNRPLRAGEVLFYRDVGDLADEVRANLLPGESTLTVLVPKERIALKLRGGDHVGFRLRGDQPAKGNAPKPAAAPAPVRLVGPFRLVAIGKPHESKRSDGPKAVVVAVNLADTKQADQARAVEEALRADPREERILTVEQYRTR